MPTPPQRIALFTILLSPIFPRAPIALVPILAVFATLPAAPIASAVLDAAFAASAAAFAALIDERVASAAFIPD